jgi:TonB family protein
VAIDSCHETEGVTPPKLIHYVDADYPEQARRERLEGISTVQLIIDEKGNPHEVTVKHSIADSFSVLHRDAGMKMDANAIKSVKKFRFAPAMVRGQPAIVQINVEVNYHLLPEN